MRPGGQASSCCRVPGERGSHENALSKLVSLPNVPCSLMGEAPKWESSRLPQSPTRCTAPRVTATDPMCLFGSDAFQSDSRGLHWWQTLLCFQFSNRRPNLDCPVTPERLIRDYPKKSNLLLHTGHLCSLSGVLTQREMTDIFPFHGHLVWVIWILRFYHQPLGSGCGRFRMKRLLIMISLSQEASLHGAAGVSEGTVPETDHEWHVPRTRGSAAAFAKMGCTSCFPGGLPHLGGPWELGLRVQ